MRIPSSFFSMHFVLVLVVHPYNSAETAKARKKSRATVESLSIICKFDLSVKENVIRNKIPKTMNNAVLFSFKTDISNNHCL